MSADEVRRLIRQTGNLMKAIAKGGHPESLLCPVKECYVTGSRINLHKHHVFGGPLRKKSEKWGCWVWLRADYHNMSEHGVHFDRQLDLRIKRDCQAAFEALYGHETYMREFGKNHL